MRRLNQHNSFDVNYKTFLIFKFYLRIALKFNRAGYDLAKSGSFIALEDKTKAGKNLFILMFDDPVALMLF